ncbi:MAG TPA: dihydroneopterin aldolase [Terriglobia bacterium]|nr:dihydroneopterin aldolase [Terriglobia bacterium]
MDKILITGMTCQALVGITAEERSALQPLLIDLEFLTDARKAAGTDSIQDAVDYSLVAAVVADVCTKQPYHLIETIAERIAERVLADFPTPGTRVLVRKISPLTKPKAEHVAVEISRP